MWKGIVAVPCPQYVPIFINLHIKIGKYIYRFEKVGTYRGQEPVWGHPYTIQYVI